MAKKRIILMYISESSGHHRATLAIEKALKSISPSSSILNINAFRYTNPISEKIVNSLYMSIIKRTPKIWDYLYDNPAVVKKVAKTKALIHKVNSPKLKNLFDKFAPDAVICTQAFPCGMVADYKKTYSSDLPLIAVLTDFVPHSYWLYDAVDYYITPSEEISRRLIKKGVPQKKIRSFGIPIDQKFAEPCDREKILGRLKFKPGIPTILIMGGSQGLGPIKSIVKSLEKVGQELQEIIVTGANKSLYRTLKRRVKKYSNKIILYRYVQNIEELMCACDLICTKPGGITTAETLAKKRPLLIIKPIPGQEMNNALFLTEKNAAIKIENPRKIHVVVQDLLKHPYKIQRLKESIETISRPNASLDVARFILDL